jgi:hypothetical protein
MDLEVILEQVESEPTPTNDIDIDAIVTMLEENKLRMTTAPPWACGLVSVIGELCTKVKALEIEKNGLRDSLQFSERQLRDQKDVVRAYKAEVRTLEQCMVKLSQITSNQGVTLDMLEEKSIKLDSHQRGKNLLFRGIPEDGYNSMDDCLKKVDNVLERMLDLDPHHIKVNKCHRVGPIRPGAGRGQKAARPILVELAWGFNRAQILQRGYMLARTGVSIDEDHPVEVVQRRATLNSIATRAKGTKGYEGTRVVGDRLMVKGKAYTVETATTLPEPINPVAHATKSDGESTLFYSRYSKLSNHSPAHFVVDDTMYRSTEQYYFSEMCRLGGDEEQSKKVKATKDPKDAQRLGRQGNLNPDFKWAEHEEQVMEKGCYAKFSQHKSSKRALLSTENQNLGESSKNRHWGIGKYMDHPNAYNSGAWDNNLLGKVLTSVRNTIRSEMGDPE